MHHEWNIYFRMKMKFDIFATLTCVSRPCFDFSVIFFTPSSTLDSVIGSYVSVTIIVFNVLILICGSLLYLSPMCVQFQTSCVSFVLLALGLCFFWITWVQDDGVQKIWFMIFIFYIYITKMTFQSCFSLLEVLPGKGAQAHLQHTKTSNLEKNRLEALLRWKSVL